MKSRSYLNKIVVVVSVLISLCGCNKQEVEDIEYQYTEPCNDTNLFSYLKTDVKEKLFNINSGSTLSDGQLKMLNVELYDGAVEDINGNEIDFNQLKDKKIVLEIVSIHCNHCKTQVSKYNPEIIKNHPELTFIQFFAEGNKDEIKTFYQDNNVTLDDSVTVIPSDEEFLDYILEIGVTLTPTLLCFVDGKITWPEVGFTTSIAFNHFYDTAFNNLFNVDELVDEKGNSIFENRRTKEDVKNDLSEEDVNRLIELDNDGCTEELTYSIIGQTLNYSDLYIDNTGEIVDYSEYQDKNVVIFYIYLTGLQDTDKECLKLINKIINKYKDIEFINVIVDEELSTYQKYLSYHYDLLGKTVSEDSSLPKDFSKIGTYNYPTAIFVEKGTYVGTYSSVSDVDGFNDALNLFIGENSIAHLN